MQLSIATWNINSIRLRSDLTVRFLQTYQPDILCLQEIKCPNDKFPGEPFEELGYRHQAIHGQKSYHGVATLSRLPFKDVRKQSFCGKDDARHVVVTVDTGADTSVDIHNFYVPAGGDEPDPEANDKFAHKLAFLKEMAAWLADDQAHLADEMIVLGDLNIAPFENDVWSHKQLLKVVSHTPIEVAHLEEVRGSRDWVDVMRDYVPLDEKLFTWWSYRARDWQSSDKGRRLDHIWLTPPLTKHCRHVEVLKDVRGWPQPSDHAPVLARFDFG